MTPTPNAVERCKAVPITDRWPNGWGSCSNLVDTAIMWEAIDLLAADNVRLRDVARAAEGLMKSPEGDAFWFDYRNKLIAALDAARSSGARGGGDHG